MSRPILAAMAGVLILSIAYAVYSIRESSKQIRSLRAGHLALEAALREADERVESLEESRTLLDFRIIEIESRPSTDTATTSVDAIRAAVEDWFEDHPPSASVSDSDDDSAADSASLPESPAFDSFDDAIAVLSDPRVPHRDREEAWAYLRASKEIDRAVASFEAHSKKYPDNPETHVDLGRAYLEKLNTVGDLEKGIWAMKADKSFGEALARDDHHWDARFNKAVSLTFWPAFMGKQGEAIENFQILIDQQEQSPHEPRQSQPYLYLGNIYNQRGDTDKAAEIWARGHERFPDHAELESKFESSGEAGEKKEE